MAEPLVTVDVIIAGRKYPVKATAQEAERLTTLQDQVNNDLADIQLKYADRDKQDCLSMTLLSYAMKLAAYEDSISDQVTSLEASLDSV